MLYKTEKIAEFLRMHRFLRKMDVRKLAKEIGIPKATYHDVEVRKRRYIGMDTMLKISDWMWR